MSMISCIITTYNRSVNILLRAVMSVLNQTYKNIELIVINDCPEKDELSNEIEFALNKLNDSRIKYIKNLKNGGACQARNVGIGQAGGKFLAFLDDDDEWLPNKLERQIKYMDKEDVGLVYCDNYIINSKTVLHHNTPNKMLESNEKTLLLSNFIGGTSFPLLRKSAVVECGGFDINLKSSQDVDMWIRIAQKYECKYCPEPLVNYYITDISITNCSKSKVEGYDYFMNKYKRCYLQDKNLYHKKLLNISGLLFSSKMKDDAARYYKEALKVKLFSIDNIVVPIKCTSLRMRKKIKGY